MDIDVVRSADARPEGKAPDGSRRLLRIALALVTAGTVGAWLVQTGAGSVSVSGIRLPTQDGQWIVADLFRPVTATAKSPAPAVVVCPGFERSKETMDAYSIELARRGVVVVTIDPYGQGASSASLQRRSTTVEGNGVIPVVEYLHGTPNLNYVDKARIGAVGYSSGGNAVLQSAARFGERAAKTAKRRGEQAAAGPEGAAAGDEAAKPARGKLAAVFAAGYVLTLTDEVLAPIRANVGMDYASFDEGAYRNVLGHADMRTAPEALRLVNSIYPGEEKKTEVEIGRPYGDPAAGTLRVVYNTRNIHPLMPYDPEHIANVLRYFGTVFGLETPLAPASQVWWLKELFTLASLVGALLLLVPLSSLLLRLPLFRELARPVPPKRPRLEGSGRLLFWAMFIVSALFACFLFVPLARATAVLFPAASTRLPTWWFPQRINNAILLWAIANGAIGLAMTGLAWLLHGRKRGVTREMLGLSTTGRELAKTLGLALTVAAGFYGLLFLCFGLFHVDFRFTFVSAAASFPSRMVLVALEYLPGFFVFYFANSVRVNSAGRFEGQRERASLLVNALGNSVGLMLILAIQYATFAATGTIYWKEEWLYVNLLFGVIPMMFVLPIFNRKLFELTGRVYLGPMVTCLVFIMMMLTSNVCYIPVP